MAEREIRYVEIDEQQLRLFRKHAQAALARRDSGFFTENWMFGVELLAIAVMGLIGLYLLDWSPLAALAAMLVGAWASFLGDFIKYLLARASVQRMAKSFNQDAQVWAVAEALSRDETRYREDRLGGYAPGLGLFVDFTFGGIASVLIAGSAGLGNWEVWRGLLQHPEWRWVLIGLVWWQLMAAALTTLRHAWLGERAGAIRFQAGARGVGLFLLMFMTLMFFEGESEGAARAVMTTANICLLLLALLSFPGVWLLLRETHWLRDFLLREHRNAGQVTEIRHNRVP